MTPVGAGLDRGALGLGVIRRGVHVRLFHNQPSRFSACVVAYGLHTEVNSDTVLDAIGKLEGRVGAAAHAKGALVLAQCAGNDGHILGALREDHAPRGEGGIGGVVGVETEVIAGVVREIDLALKLGMGGESLALRGGSIGLIQRHTGRGKETYANAVRTLGSNGSVTSGQQSRSDSTLHGERLIGGDRARGREGDEEDCRQLESNEGQKWERLGCSGKEKGQDQQHLEERGLRWDI